MKPSCLLLSYLAVLALPLVAAAQCVQVRNANLFSFVPPSSSWNMLPQQTIYDPDVGYAIALVAQLNAFDHSNVGSSLYCYNGTGNNGYGWAFCGGGTTNTEAPYFPDNSPAMVYDTWRHQALLFGGSTLDLHSYNLLWALEPFRPDPGHPSLPLGAPRWRIVQVAGTTPPVPLGAYGAFDPNRGRAIFLLELSLREYQAWEWDGAQWTAAGERFTLSGGYFNGFTFDPVHNVGFAEGVDQNNNDMVWYYHPGQSPAWQQQPVAAAPTANGNLVTDIHRGKILSCCGVVGEYGYLTQIAAWNYANASWDPYYADLGPGQGRDQVAVAFDANRDTLVIAGGYYENSPGLQGDQHYLDDTWELTDGAPGILASTTGNTAHCVGDTAVFSLTGVGSVVNYQWFHGGSPITTATSQLLVINNLQATDAGNYVGRVYNDCGYMDTPIIRLRVDQPTTIFRPAVFPDCSKTCVGATIIIYPPIPIYTGVDLTTHLQKNIGSVLTPVWVDVRVDTPTAPMDFVFTNVDKSFTGNYRFYIDGSACPGIVASITNYIQVGFDITTQPQSLNHVRPCSVVTFSVSTSGGCSLTYQWYSERRGILFDDGHFSGTTSSSLTINGTHFDDEDKYFCDVIDVGQCDENLWTDHASLTMTLPQWVLRTTKGPSPRYANAMAYDSQRGVTIMYGGGVAVENTGYLGYGEVWEWDGAKWRQRTTYNWTNAWHQVAGGYWQPMYGDTPAARMQHAMTYDSRRGRMVMFGGRSAIATNIYSDFTFGDTWEWDGTRWYLGATNGPEPRYDCHMGYDPVRSVAVLYGGLGVPANKIWEWNGTNWTSIIYTNGPVNYYNEYACQVFDTYLNTLFVGPTDDGFGYNHFYWTWDGRDWHSRALGFLFGSNITPINGNMVYDTYRFRALHFGGQMNGFNNMYGGTAAGYYDSASDAWSVLPDEALSSNFDTNDFLNVPSLVSKLSSQNDPVSQYLWSNFATSDQQTLTNSGVSITQKENALAFTLNNIISNNIVYDTNRFAGVALSPETVVFHDLNPAAEDLIRFNRLLIEDAYPAEVARSPSFPTGRDQFAMAFDSARRCAVVMGGFYNGPGLNPLNGSDTWELMYLDTPLINGQPASQYRAVGDTAVFTVNAIAPYGTTLMYQWYLGAVPLSDSGRISGTHSSTLRIAEVNPGDAGQYHALISAACGTIYTAPAILTTDPGLQIFSAQQGAAQLVWSTASLILQQADSVGGPWTTVAGATSPFDLTFEGPGKFFRLNTNSAVGP